MSALAEYLALGDSYTIGEAVAADECWPALLARHLRTEHIALGEPQIVAVTGWTTDELAQGVDEAVLTPPYALVTLQIGVNNQYRGRTVAEYREQFAALLVRAVALAGDRPEQVVVVSIPDWGVTRFAGEQGRDRLAIARELDAFNAVARAATGHSGAHFVDITGISRAYPELVAADGLHPAAAQYRLWLAAIAPVAAQAWRRGR